MSQPRIQYTAHLVLRGMGLVYAVAFVSLGVQVLGLVGGEGIVPVVDTLARVHNRFGNSGWWWMPTVFWINASNLALTLCWVFGGLLAAAVALGRVRSPLAMIGLWVLYLSYCSVSGGFLDFQWDVLLLEAGLVSVFLVDGRGGSSALGLWLMRLLLVKLLVLSGLVKLLSGDSSWLDATALDYHFFTQPLPNRFSWGLHHAPSWMRQAGVWLTLLVELPVAFLALGPPRARLVCFSCTVVLMVIIVFTGSYGFFNLLTVVVALSLLEDQQLRWVWRRLPESPAPVAEPGVTRLFCLLWVGVSGVLGARTVLGDSFIPQPLSKSLIAISPLRSCNSYGLFRVMTKTRPELILEVSGDGENWEVWPFRWKPSNPVDPPRAGALHMPRLDWQLWFAALAAERNRDTAWVHSFMLGVLEGRKPVLKLLGPSPLGGLDVLAVRMRVDDYRFSSPTWRSQSGHWWTSETRRLYAPPIGLRR